MSRRSFFLQVVFLENLCFKKIKYLVAVNNIWSETKHINFMEQKSKNIIISNNKDVTEIHLFRRNLLVQIFDNLMLRILLNEGALIYYVINF